MSSTIFNNEQRTPVSVFDGDKKFGNSYYSMSDETDHVLVTTDPTELTRIDTVILPRGTYKFAWSYSWNVSQIRNPFIADFKVDGIVRRTHRQSIASIENPPTYEFTCNGEQVPASGFFEIEFTTEEEHSFSLEVYGKSLEYQIAAWDIMLEMYRTK